MTVLDGIPVLLVHLTAPLDELDRRERERGDRDLGTARAQAELVFAHGDCDLELDTSTLSTEDAARTVRDLVESWPSTTAFERLRSRQL